MRPQAAGLGLVVEGTGCNRELQQQKAPGTEVRGGWCAALAQVRSLALCRTRRKAGDRVCVGMGWGGELRH